jgi:hypothetical protein
MAELSRKNLSETEIGERIAIVKRFKELLLDQRARFQNYLEVLDKQKDLIETGKPDDLISHIELEEKIVADIFAIQKAVVPMQVLYNAVWKDKPDAEIPQISAVLEHLKVQALDRSTRNKAMFEQRMATLRTEMKALRSNPFKQRRSVYSDPNQPMLIDIQG